MIDFYKLVEDCIKNDSEKLIFNASYEHAHYLFKRLFQLAGKEEAEVRITTGHLRKDFYESLEPYAKKAIEKGAHIRLVILDNAIDVDDNSFATLVKKSGDLYRTKTKLKAPHFILVGDRRLRVETDHEQTKAMASFNDKSLGSFLEEQFETLVDPQFNYVDKLSTTQPAA